MSRNLIVALAIALSLTLAACGKKGDLDAPPGADPAHSKDIFSKPR